MAQRCYIHGPTTTAGTCPTCDAMQSDARDAEITRLRARLAEAEAAKAAVWDEAMTAAVEAAPTPTEDVRDKETLAYIQGFMDLVQSIRALVNPYRSKTDEPQ